MVSKQVYSVWRQLGGGRAQPEIDRPGSDSNACQPARSSPPHPSHSQLAVCDELLQKGSSAPCREKKTGRVAKGAVEAQKQPAQDARHAGSAAAVRGSGGQLRPSRAVVPAASQPRYRWLAGWLAGWQAGRAPAAARDSRSTRGCSRCCRGPGCAGTCPTGGSCPGWAPPPSPAQQEARSRLRWACQVGDSSLQRQGSMARRSVRQQRQLLDCPKGAAGSHARRAVRLLCCLQCATRGGRTCRAAASK